MCVLNANGSTSAPFYHVINDEMSEATLCNHLNKSPSLSIPPSLSLGCFSIVVTLINIHLLPLPFYSWTGNVAFASHTTTLYY